MVVACNLILNLMAYPPVHVFRYRNYWSDACLDKAAAGSPVQPGQFSLDFYQIHSYPSGGGFDPESPFVGKNKSFYGLKKYCPPSG